MATKKAKEENKDCNEVPENMGVRHVLAILGFLGLTSAYSMRVNLSVAIVAMVNNTGNDKNESSSTSCPIEGDYYSNVESEVSRGEFDWDENTQGLVHSSFYYGYILTNILGGLASERFGGRLVNGLGILFTSILTILSPFAARISSGLFIAVRILEGCGEGVTLPALSYMLAKWYPTKERSKFSTTVFAGMQFGTVLTLAISGWLSASNFLGGWPSVFYVFGFLGLVWSFFWFWLVRDDPSSHPSISDVELKYIKSGVPDTEERFSVPWMSIFKSRYFWVLSAMHFGNNWGFYTLLTELPTYLDQILHIHIKHNGVLSAMPYFGAWLFSIVYSLVIDRLIARNYLAILSVRRISMIIGAYGPMICLLVLCFVSCNRVLALAILIVSGTTNGAIYCGYLSSHGDISPRFAGTLMGLTNSIATIPGFVAPLIAGALTQDNQTLWAWRSVFLISAFVYGVTCTIYVAFMTVDRQVWDDTQDKELTDKENSAKSTDVPPIKPVQIEIMVTDEENSERL